MVLPSLISKKSCQQKMKRIKEKLAFKHSSLKNEVDKVLLEAEDVIRAEGVIRPEEACKDERQKEIESINVKYRAEIQQIVERHHNELLKVNIDRQEINKSDEDSQNPFLNPEIEFEAFKLEYEILLKTLEQTTFQHFRQFDIFCKETDSLCKGFQEQNLKIRGMDEDIHDSKEELEGNKGSNSALINEEIQSLRTVLDLKQSENKELRKLLAEATAKVELLPAIEWRHKILSEKCENLREQIDMQTETVKDLQSENRILKESLKEETNKNKRMLQQNEEMQWKLQQSKEVVSKVLEETSTLICNEHQFPFRERSYSNCSQTSNNSYRSRKSLNVEQFSPPATPVIKSVVEKSSAVGYVLQMNESPETIASRLIRKSMKSSPTSSPILNKKQKLKSVKNM